MIAVNGIPGSAQHHYVYFDGRNSTTRKWAGNRFDRILPNKTARRVRWADGGLVYPIDELQADLEYHGQESPVNAVDFEGHPVDRDGVSLWIVG